MEEFLFLTGRKGTQLLSIFEGKIYKSSNVQKAKGGSRIPLGHTTSANMEADLA